MRLKNPKKKNDNWKYRQGYLGRFDYDTMHPIIQWIIKIVLMFFIGYIIFQLVLSY
jgi:hypothetical protein